MMDNQVGGYRYLLAAANCDGLDSACSARLNHLRLVLNKKKTSLQLLKQNASQCSTPRSSTLKIESKQYFLASVLASMSPFLRDVWIRTQKDAVASRCATNLATHLPNSKINYSRSIEGKVILFILNFNFWKTHNYQVKKVTTIRNETRLNYRHLLSNTGRGRHLDKIPCPQSYGAQRYLSRQRGT